MQVGGGDERMVICAQQPRSRRISCIGQGQGRGGGVPEDTRNQIIMIRFCKEIIVGGWVRGGVSTRYRHHQNCMVYIIKRRVGGRAYIAQW